MGFLFVGLRAVLALAKLNLRQLNLNRFPVAQKLISCALLFFMASGVSLTSFANITEARIYYIFFPSTGGIEIYDTPEAHYAATIAAKKKAEAGAASQTIFLELYPVVSEGTINGKYKAYQYHYQISINGYVYPTIYSNGGPSISVECAKPYQMKGNNLASDLRYWCESIEPDPALNSCIGNPVLPSTGAKLQVERDYQGSNGGLQFTRTYRSDRHGWAHNYRFVGIDLTAAPQSVNWPDGGCYFAYGDNSGTPYCFKYASSSPTPANSFIVQRENSRFLSFGTSTNLLPAADINDRVSKSTDGSAWIVYNADNDSTERYDLSGRLKSITARNGQVQTLSYSDSSTPTAIAPSPGLLLAVTDHFGRKLQFTYDSLGRMASMRDPAGGVYLYAYDEASSVVLSGKKPAGNLTSVTYPDNKKRIYWYNEQDKTGNTNLPYALTGISDENGARFASYWYDASGRVIDEKHAADTGLDVDRYRLAYSPISTVVTDPLGTARTYNFTTILGVVKSTGTNQPGGSGCAAAASKVSYDANGNVASRTDFNGNKVCYAYDLSRNLETARAEGLASSADCAASLSATSLTPPARKISTIWHPTFRLPSVITEPGRKTNFTYDPSTGNLLTKTITDTATGATRTWTYTYTTSADGTPAALLKTIDGPRTDVSDITTYAYYPNGDLKTITNALGHITQITSYDPNGRPKTLVDPNNIVTTLTYKPRGWLESRTVAGETTTYGYDFVGQLTQITFPDSSFVSYTYDNAHRLTDITDALGNRIHYTLDNIGNRIKEETFNSSGSVVTTHSRVFDALNRLWKDIGATNQTTTYEYDANGNLTKIDGPLTSQADITQHQYDSLNRLIKSTDALAGITRYDYDPLDQLKTVTDPRNLTTSYTVNALGDQTKLISPDTGSTNQTYDAAGNLKTKTDADGKLVTYSYDALNRLISIQYGSTVTYTLGYDSGANAKGKLTSITQAGGNTSYTYNSKGRLDTKTQTTGALTLITRYAYTPAGQLQSITYPSGKVVAYGYQASSGLLTSLTINGTPLLQSAYYQPFGPIAGWTWGNGTAYSRHFDTDGRLDAYPLANNTRSLGYDAASRIQNKTDTNPSNTTTYTYDVLDRLQSWLPGSTNQSYYYDANGNRTSLVLGASSYTYTLSPTSNRLNNVAGPIPKTYTYNNAGSLTNDGSTVFGYDGGNRMVSASRGTTTNYTLNALGQRIVKSTSSSSTQFLYDEAGHLIGEYSPTGSPIAETVYLGDTPVAVMK